MAITKNRESKKSPSQNPVAFFKGVQAGGATGKSSYVAPEKLTGGPVREKIMGIKGRS